MILMSLLILLVVLGLAAMHFFLFSMLLPSLKAAEQTAYGEPLFAPEEIDVAGQYPDFAYANGQPYGREAIIPQELLSAQGIEPVSKKPLPGTRAMTRLAQKARRS